MMDVFDCCSDLLQKIFVISEEFSTRMLINENGSDLITLFPICSMIFREISSH